MCECRSKQCTEPYTEADHFVEVIDSKHSWLESFEKCVSLGYGYELATLREPREVALLNQAITTEQSYWVAATD